MLTETINGTAGGVGVASFLKTLKGARQKLCHKDDVPKGKEMGQVHAVCLQMIAKGIISLNVTDRTKVGTDKIEKKHLAVTCPRAKRNVDGDECWCPGFMVDELWEGLNLSS